MSARIVHDMKAPSTTYELRINGIDLTGMITSASIERSVSFPDCEEVVAVSINLKKEFSSENGSAHRHLKGLQKAKD